MFLPFIDCLQYASIHLLIQFVQLKRDASPQVYQRFALLCRQYLEKSELSFRNVVNMNAVECGQLRLKQIVRDVFDGVFVGTGDDASRQVVSNQLLSLLTLRCVHFRVSLNSLRGIVSDPGSLVAATNAWCRLSNVSSSIPKVSAVGVAMFCLPKLCSVSSICSVSSFSHRVLQQRQNGRSWPRLLDRCSQMQSGRQIRGACAQTFLLDSV